MGSTTAELSVTLTGQALHWPGLLLGILRERSHRGLSTPDMPVVWQRKPSHCYGHPRRQMQLIHTDAGGLPQREPGFAMNPNLPVMPINRPFHPLACPGSLPRGSLERIANRFASHPSLCRRAD